MSLGTVTVFGGSGFIVRRIVERLARTAAQVRVAVRQPERVRAPATMAEGTKLVPVRADVRDEASIAAAVAGAAAVVNSVSTYVEGRGITFADIHEKGAAAVARAANEAGVARLV